MEPAAEEAARDGATSQAAGAQPTPDFVLSWGELSLVRWRTGSGFGGVPTFGEAMNPSLGTVITLAEVRLTLSDPQRSLQLAAAQGRGSHIDSGLTREFATPAARAAACTGVADAHWPPCAALLLRAFADAHAKLVPLLHAYKTQKLPANAGAPDAPPRSPDTLAGPAH